MSEIMQLQAVCYSGINDAVGTYLQLIWLVVA